MAMRWIAILLLAASSALAQPGDSEKKAVPVDPITAVLETFRSHPIVALDEGSHNNEQGHAFRLALIRDPRFAKTVNDIVVEAGNSRYQDVMDQFVHGEDIPYEVLRQVWQDTTQPNPVWDSPIYEEFYRVVRTLNATLPPERQLRVLLGDPPIDWSTVRNREDLVKQWEGQRNEYPADLIRREVLAKGRRALIVYGGMHLQRKDLLTNYKTSETMVGLLESYTPGTVFTIWTNTKADLETVQGDVSSWPKPSLVKLRGTVLGTKEFTFYYAVDVVVRDSKGTPVPQEARRSLRMEDQFDAVLYLGPPSSITYSHPLPTLCGDPSYVKMRSMRMALLFPPERVEQFKKNCAAITPQ